MLETRVRDTSTVAGSLTLNPGGTPIVSGTVGSVLFIGIGPSLAQDNANFFWDDTNNRLGITTSSPTNTLSFSGNSAQTIAMERHTASNTAGNSLTIQSGGPTSGATNRSPGDLILRTNLSTGNAGGNIRFGVPRPGASGTVDNSPVNQVRITIDELSGARNTADADSFGFGFYKSRGTVDSPAEVQVGDTVAQFGGLGYVGATNQYLTASLLEFTASNSISDAATGIGGTILFYTAKNGIGLRIAHEINADMLETFRGSIFMDSATYGVVTNLGIGTTTFGTSANRVIGIAIGTEATTSPVNMIQIGSADMAADGTASMTLRTEDAVVTESLISNRTLRVKINGTVYKALLST